MAKNGNVPGLALSPGSEKKHHYQAADLRSSPALLHMAGALLVIRKGFNRKTAGTKYGRYQGVTCHFFRHVQKRELAKFHFAAGVFKMGIGAAVKISR